MLFVYLHKHHRLFLLYEITHLTFSDLLWFFQCSLFKRASRVFTAFALGRSVFQDCMEEINLFSENKTHLKQLGEQLITASNKTKETEINDKLKDINDRWQHLFDHIEAR